MKESFLFKANKGQNKEDQKRYLKSNLIST